MSPATHRPAYANHDLPDATASARAAAWRRWVTGFLAVAILIPSLLGFGNKFLEFVVLFRGDADGAFAISPILNYLLASLGFFCLFCWAIFNGMFRDIEQPKHSMLEVEARLDAGLPGGAPGAPGAPTAP